ncbi:unnamed protein product [Oreochromis niloticus]|nr:unnamed protein product [Mustela putorius furo]
MTLMRLINSRPETPYFRPPPLHVRVLKVCEQARVIKWDVKEGVAKPISKKCNMVAALSDGVTVVKVTLFEAFASKVQEGVSYIIKGHELKGTAPPYAIHISATTQFFRASALCVPEELLSKADNLLHPPAPFTQLKMSSTNVGLITVEGEVVECLAIRKVVSGNQEVPVKNVQLKQVMVQLKCPNKVGKVMRLVVEAYKCQEIYSKTLLQLRIGEEKQFYLYTRAAQSRGLFFVPR